ncbi:hypothetical protein L7F22_046544 [Adiantum nelumboides]|nr:hypothetical protein [Adiantum nelumboides]
MAGKRKEGINDYNRNASASFPCHVHLLGMNFLSLQASSSSSSCKWLLQQNSGAALAVHRVEAMGIVVGVDRKEKYLRFLLDDGSGSCIPCILWLNLLTLVPRPYFTHPHSVISTQVRAECSLEEASKVTLGALIRVQGRVSYFNQQRQITVSSLQVESDPNAELFHWLDCMRLALHHYNLPPSHHQ